MKYLIDNIKKYEDCLVPKEFIKNKYSKTEYALIKKGLSKFYGINEFKVLYTSNGKPYLDNDIYISISTNKDIVIVAFSNEEIGADLEFYKDISNNFKKFLNIPNKFNSKESLKEFCKRESIIKLEGLTLKQINNIDLSKYKIKTFYRKEYLFVICTRV